MNRYFQLLKNVLILGLGQFASKIVSYFLLPLYTGVLTDAEYGTADLVTNTANLLIPLVSLSIYEAVVRFAMESKQQRSDALTAGYCTVFLGYGVFVLFLPLICQISLISDYVWILYIYVLSSLINTVSGLFARCIGYMRLYAVSGFLNTLSVLCLNLLFLLGFKWGVTGYLLSIVFSDLLSALFVFVLGNLKRYVKPWSKIRRPVWKRMLRFSIPLIPNSLCWWIVNLSDSYLIGYMLVDGAAVNGLYRVAYKIPALVNLVSTIFLQAWQLSAIASYNEADKARFYTKVLNTLQMLVFCTASLLMLLVRPIMSILVSDAFYEAWKYVPFLLAASSFGCFVNYYATLYVAAKRSLFSMLTALTGAVANVVLNSIMIPLWGAQGAAFATLISYFIVFLVRGVDCRKKFGIRLQPVWIAINSLIMVWQAFMMILGLSYSLAVEIVLFLLMLALNAPKLLQSVKALWAMRKGCVSPAPEGFTK